MTQEDLKAREELVPEGEQEVGPESPEELDHGPDTETDFGSEAGESPDMDADSGIEDGRQSETEGEEATEAALGRQSGVDAGLQTALEGREDSEAGADSKTELETTQVELNRLRDQHLRLAADFENHRKRANADRGGVWLRAQADLVRSLVEGLDDLQRVSQFTSEDTTVEALIEGVDLVERNLLKALTEAGLKVLNPEGERFDPNSMEAMMRVPTEEDGQDETVHQVFQKGYMFKDQLVRPARVSVYMDED